MQETGQNETHGTAFHPARAIMTGSPTENKLCPPTIQQQYDNGAWRAAAFAVDVALDLANWDILPYASKQEDRNAQLPCRLYRRCRDCSPWGDWPELLAGTRQRCFRDRKR